MGMREQLDQAEKKLYGGNHQDMFPETLKGGV